MNTKKLWMSVNNFDPNESGFRSQNAFSAEYSAFLKLSSGLQFEKLTDKQKVDQAVERKYINRAVQIEVPEIVANLLESL